MSDKKKSQTQKGEEQRNESNYTTDSGNRRGTLTILGLLGVGLVLFLTIFHFIGWGKIFSCLGRLDLPLFFLAMGAVFCSVSLWAMRWKLFVNQNGREVSFVPLFKYLVVGLAANNLTPLAKFGGEPVRAYLLRRKENIQMREGLANIVAELSVMFFVIVGTVTLSISLLFLLKSPPTWFKLLLIPFAGIVLLVFFLIRSVYSEEEEWIARFLNWIGEKLEDSSRTKTG